MTAAEKAPWRTSKVCADSDQTFKVDTGLVKNHNRDLAKTIAMTNKSLRATNIKESSGGEFAAQDSFIMTHKDLGKTRLCVNIVKKGKCYLGTRCGFAHCESEIQKLPDLAKTQLCTKFMNGNCTNTNCSFAHGEEELINRPGFKKKMCTWFAQGKCRNGSSCGFIHGGVDNAATKSTVQTPSMKMAATMKPTQSKLTAKLTVQTPKQSQRTQQQAQDEVDSDASTDVPSRVPSDDDLAAVKKARPTMQSSCVKLSRNNKSALAKCGYQFETRAILGMFVAAAVLMVEYSLSECTLY